MTRELPEFTGFYDGNHNPIYEGDILRNMDGNPCFYSGIGGGMPEKDGAGWEFVVERSPENWEGGKFKWRYRGGAKFQNGHDSFGPLNKDMDDPGNIFMNGVIVWMRPSMNNGRTRSIEQEKMEPIRVEENAKILSENRKKIQVTIDSETAKDLRVLSAKMGITQGEVLALALKAKDWTISKGTIR